MFNNIEKYFVYRSESIINCDNNNDFQTMLLSELGLNINFSYEFTKTTQFFYNFFIKLLHNTEYYFRYNPFLDYWAYYANIKVTHFIKDHSPKKILIATDQSYYKLNVKLEKSNINNIIWPPKGSYCVICF